MISQKSGKISAAIAKLPFRHLAPDSWTLLLAAALFGAALIAIVGGGIRPEDAVLANTVALAHESHGGTLPALIALWQRDAALGSAWFPASFVPLLPWTLFSNGWTINILQFLFVVLNGVTFAALVHRMSGSRQAALLSVALCVAAIELRPYHDPIVGTSFTQPWIAELLLLGLVCWICWYYSASVSMLYGAVALFALAALTNPVGYLFSLAFCGLTLFHSKKKMAPILAALVLVLMPAIFISFVLTQGGRSADLLCLQGSVTSCGHFAEIWRQLIAALPLAWRVSGNVTHDVLSTIVHDTSFDHVPPIGIAGWLTAGLAAGIVFVALARGRSWRWNSPAITLSAGICLWVFPALFLPHTQWQHGLPMGFAYSSVYLEYFGVALLLSLCLHHLTASASEVSGSALIAAAMSLTAFFILYGNARASSLTMARLQKITAIRELLIDAGASGLFDRLPPAGRIALDDSTNPYFQAASRTWFSSGLMLEDAAHREIATLPLTSLAFGGPLCPKRRCTTHAAPARIWILQVLTGDGNRPTVALERWAGTDDSGFLTDRAYAYYQFASSIAASRSLPSLNREKPGVRLRARTTNGALFVSAQRRCGAVPIQRAFDSQVPHWRWGTGFYPVEPYNNPTPLVLSYQFVDNADNPDWRYAGTAARIEVAPLECNLPILVSLGIYTPAPAKLTVTIGRRVQRYQVSQIGRIVHLRIDPSWHAGTVRLLSTSVSAPEDVFLARYPNTPRMDIRMLVVRRQVWYGSH